MMEVLAQDESTIEDCRMALKTAYLERDYLEAIGHASRILDAEKGRNQQVEQLFVEFENDSLQLQLDRLNQDLARSMRRETDARQELRKVYEDLNRSHQTAVICSRETEELREELASVNTVSADSQKLVAEKTRLSRDLASLQSEAERLRSQAASTSAAIAEKQALERQFNALDVELEDEKRAHNHTRAQASKLSDEIVTLTTKLDETRKKLAEVESSAHQQSRKWASERTTLEAKIESLSRKQSLDQESLAMAQANNQRRPVAPEATRLADPPPQTVPLKDQSRSSRFDPGMTISTPGAVRGAEKKKQPITRPGEKSAFSITPFLERTKGRDSTMSSDESENDTPVARAVDRAREQRSEAPSEGRSIASSNREPSVSANEAVSEEQPAQAKPKAKVTKKTQKKPSNLVDASDMAGTSASLFNRAPGLGMAKTKKRKLGGQRDKTLLDDDFEEEPSKDLKKPAAFGAFSTFSPLKKDRRR
ncbi:uncharacterized protein BDW47DRAFT_122241 [Aspergillus candidus]|uniref:Uncharacterized protein n=1 Tax=Aspergillus candidus TaxID=41067 RepID=A0A2I2FMD3_ASPCN|nr:hypothetical protein BDW47DRAFT_122241 [Aspergillus candidus]PLB41790.1 hypothetical protein BDW47DRAFT_122241 [Aspergillus candidus]